MNVGELIEFLSQFSSDQVIFFCIEGEGDPLGNIRTYSEPSGEPDFPGYPMIVFETTDRCDECGAIIPADDASMVSRAHARSCSLNPNNTV